MHVPQLAGSSTVPFQKQMHTKLDMLQVEGQRQQMLFSTSFGKATSGVGGGGRGCRLAEGRCSPRQAELPQELYYTCLDSKARLNIHCRIATDGAVEHRGKPADLNIE